MSKIITQDDLFQILASYESRLERSEAALTDPGRTNGLVIPGVGIAGSKRAGRKLLVADFTQLLGVAAPIALYNFDNNANDSSGNARHLAPTTAAPTYADGIE